MTPPFRPPQLFDHHRSGVMGALDDDIARIAALRGRKASDYADGPRSVPLSGGHLSMILCPTNDARADILVADSLPAASRTFLRESPCQLSALAWAAALQAGVSESAIIAAVSRGLPKPIRRQPRRRFS